MSLISELGPVIKEAFQGACTVAFDMEGIDLSRVGEICLMQIATPEKVFVIDVLGKNRDDPLICWVRNILQNPGVVKIVHDCRMDSDALYHILGISLENVHDTSRWHEAITGEVNKALNDVLDSNGLKSNVVRDKNVYTVNHRFWETRPVTQSMVQWASGDVAVLFELYDRQVNGASAEMRDRAKHLSNQNIHFTRGMNLALIHVHSVGPFIGKGGANVRALQNRSNTLIYGKGNRVEKNFMVFYRTDADLNKVMAEVDVGKGFF